MHKFFCIINLTEIILLPRVNKLYVVKGCGSECECIFSISTNLNSEIVASLSLEKKMSKNKYVNVNENNNCKNRNNICKSCIIAKSNRKSFKRRYLYKCISSQILDTAYNDFMKL